MRIEELLNKYFEGETSCQEEKELRALFMKGDVPEELKVYTPLFAYMEQEVQEFRSQKKKKNTFFNHILYAISGVAACLLLVLATNAVYTYSKPDSYVIIDGKRYTDTELIREHAQIAFNDVKFTQDELFESLFE